MGRINSCNLMNLYSDGMVQSTRGGMRVYGKLDRALCNDVWKLLFLNLKVKKVLTRVDFSYHHLIVITLQNDDDKRDKNYDFKFECAWVLEESYEVLTEAWKDEGNLISKLEEVERNARKWNYHTIRSLAQKKNNISNQICGVQKINQAHNWHAGLNKLEIKLQIELDKVLHQEELMSYQRSKMDRLIEGDRNTRFLFLKALSRRQRKNINMIKDIVGAWIEDLVLIKNQFNECFQTIYTPDVEVVDWHQTTMFSLFLRRSGLSSFMKV
ncbi:unnamed protein product [Vicia faba]|uniref:Uncharacterized protein n=1 Tax=Vicia faba TaxID=3906 RepID=A0AAV0YTW7_VICFA|nr:unnamed protein product [Vicia faba]